MVDAANSLNCDVGIRLGVREMKSAPPPPPNESKKVTAQIPHPSWC